MSDTQPKDAELTPEARSIIKRARTSFLFTIGLLILGFIAIAGALVYRASRDTAPAAASNADYAIAALKVPDGAEVVSAVAADGRVTLTYRTGTTMSVRIFDGKTGEILREIPVVTE